MDMSKNRNSPKGNGLHDDGSGAIGEKHLLSNSGHHIVMRCGSEPCFGQSRLDIQNNTAQGLWSPKVQEGGVS